MKAQVALQLTIEILQHPVHLDRSCPVRVTLSNVGPDRALVNGRLAVGYRRNLARELYGELIDLATDRPALIYQLDYDRSFSLLSDYIWLSSGEAISTSFDLWKWYAPTQPGRYRLVIHYQADERLANPPGEIAPGVYAGAPVELDVLGSSSEQSAEPALLG